MVTRTRSKNLRKLGDLVRQWREDIGWTQLQLSTASGASANRISEIESGSQKRGRDSRPSKLTLTSIAVALEKDPLVLLRLVGHDLDLEPQVGPVHTGLARFLSRHSLKWQKALLRILTLEGRNGVEGEPSVGNEH